MGPMEKPPPPATVLSPATLRTSGALLAAQTALNRVLTCDAVTPTGHDPTVIDLLIRLDQAPGTRLRAIDLSRQLRLSPSHISRTIDRAQSAGLVRRSADLDDRRATQITLTDQGRRALARFAPFFEAVIEKVIHQTLTPTEADTLVTLLRKIEDAADGSPSTGCQ